MSQFRLSTAGLSLALIVTACAQPGAGTTDAVSTVLDATLPSVVPRTETSAGARMEVLGDPSETPRPTATMVAATATISPTRLRIVYIDAGNVVLIEDGGAPLALTHSGNADADTIALSGDGARIAFTTTFVPPSYTRELRVVHSDGSGEALLLSPSDLTALHSLLPGTDDILFRMVFLPGTHTLLLSTFSSPISAYHYDDLYALDVDTGKLTTLLPPGAGGFFAASPDGRKIVFTTPESVGLIGSDGSHYRPNLITFPAVETGDILNPYYPIPLWADDSSEIGLVIPSPELHAASASAAIWHIRSDPASATQVGEIRGDFYFDGGFSPPLLSPDFSRVAFGRPSGAPIGLDLYLASPDGTGETLYATGVVSWGGWAPDGRHFIYSYAYPDNFLLGAPDAAPAPFVSGGDYFRWINGSEFLFLSGRSPALTLNRGAIGGMPRALASLTGYYVRFDFGR